MTGWVWRKLGDVGAFETLFLISRPVKQLQQRFHKAGKDAKAQRKNGMIWMNRMVRRNGQGQDYWDECMDRWMNSNGNKKVRG
jgi:hypothetical protein